MGSATANPGSDRPSAGNALVEAVRDLWAQVIRSSDDEVVFYDHDGAGARVRRTEQGFRIGWVTETEGQATWFESDRVFPDPRQAVFYAFQGRDRAAER